MSAPWSRKRSRQKSFFDCGVGMDFFDMEARYGGLSDSDEGEMDMVEERDEVEILDEEAEYFSDAGSEEVAAALDVHINGPLVPPGDPELEMEEVAEYDISKRKRRYCFTLNNYKKDGDGTPEFFALARAESRIRSLVVAMEVGASGTPHLQGYLEFEKGEGGERDGYSMKQLVKWKCFSRVSFKPAYGSAEQNKVYCLKEIFGGHKKCPDGDGNPTYDCWGPFDCNSGSGPRNVWLKVHDLARSGAEVFEFLEQAPGVCYPHIQKIPAWIEVWHPAPKRTELTRPILAFGPTRAGKSTWADAYCDRLVEEHGWRIYIKSDDEQWWPDYRGEEIVRIEEMNGGFFKWDQLKRLFDKREFTLRQKGNPRAVNLCARVIVMTCNDHPATWYEKSQSWDEGNAFRARILEFGELWVFTKPTVNPDKTRIYHAPVRDLDCVQPGLRIECTRDGVEGYLDISQKGADVHFIAKLGAIRHLVGVEGEDLHFENLNK